MTYRGEDIYKDIGRKIKVFRNIKGLSQLSLEVAIGASPGVISRIESGVTNPSKETIYRIVNVLNLNTFESEYLYGQTAIAASEEEVNSVRLELKNYFSSPLVFGYVIDDRNRMILMSDTFIKLTELEDKDLKNLYMRFMTSIITYDDSPIKSFLDQSQLEHILYNVFSGTYREMYFMIGDPEYEKMYSEIIANPLAKAWWNKISKVKLEDIRSTDLRTVPFTYKGAKIKMTYSMEPLWFNQRFRIVEYKPHNIILRAYSKLTNKIHEQSR